MATFVPTILGVSGVSLSNSEMPLFNAVIKDDDARVLRANIAPSATLAVYAIVQIDNRLNSEKVYLKCYDEVAPVIGTTPPAMILRANPGRVTEYYMTAPLAAFTYQVLTEPGKGGTDIPANAVPVTFGMQLNA